MRGLLFIPEMIRALLDGTKTQTRRLGQPRYKVGEEVYVKEVYAGIYIGGDIKAAYRVTDEKAVSNWRFTKWKSPLFMPEVASRMHLLIRDVREQMLWDIDETDARAEGVQSFNGYTDGDLCVSEIPSSWGPMWCTPGYRAGYAILWNQLQRKRPAKDRVLWSSNPPVTAYTFEVRR